MQLPDFCIFALRITNDNSIGKKILDANQYYTFLDGFYINNNTIECKSPLARMAVPI